MFLSFSPSKLTLVPLLSIPFCQGKHGAAVGAYFAALRWCFLVNMLLGVLYLGFVIIPYALQHGFDTYKRLLRPAYEGNYGSDAEFLGMFTGGVSLLPAIPTDRAGAAVIKLIQRPADFCCISFSSSWKINSSPHFSSPLHHSFLRAPSIRVCILLAAT